MLTYRSDLTIMLLFTDLKLHFKLQYTMLNIKLRAYCKQKLTGAEVGVGWVGFI